MASKPTGIKFPAQGLGIALTGLLLKKVFNLSAITANAVSVNTSKSVMFLNSKKLQLMAFAGQSNIWLIKNIPLIPGKSNSVVFTAGEIDSLSNPKSLPVMPGKSLSVHSP